MDCDNDSIAIGTLFKYNNMKWLPYILIIVLAFGLGWFVKPSPEAVIEARTDTVFSTSIIVKRDTVKYYLPSPILCWHDGDTIHVGRHCSSC